VAQPAPSLSPKKCTECTKRRTNGIAENPPPTILLVEDVRRDFWGEVRALAEERTASILSARVGSIATAEPGVPFDASAPASPGFFEPQLPIFLRDVRAESWRRGDRLVSPSRSSRPTRLVVTGLVDARAHARFFGELRHPGRTPRRVMCSMGLLRVWYSPPTSRGGAGARGEVSNHLITRRGRPFVTVTFVRRGKSGRGKLRYFFKVYLGPYSGFQLGVRTNT
jgi:hypothetical protein